MSRLAYTAGRRHERSGSLLAAAAFALSFAAAALAPVHARGPAPGSASDTMASEPVLNRDGYSAAALFALPIETPNPHAVAELADAIVDHEAGRLAALVVSARGGGLRNDRLFRIPWRHVEFTSDHTHILIPLAKHNAEEYRFEWKDLLRGERRLSSLLRPGRVELRHGEPYGRVVDVTFNRKGELKAVLIEPLMAYGTGHYAYPYARGSDRGNTYVLPLDFAALAQSTLPTYRTQPQPKAKAIGARGRPLGGGEPRYESSLFTP